MKVKDLTIIINWHCARYHKGLPISYACTQDHVSLPGTLWQNSWQTTATATAALSDSAPATGTTGILTVYSKQKKSMNEP